MSDMQFAVKTDKEPNPVFLELLEKGDGIVELWGYGPSNGYLMGFFEDGVFRTYQDNSSSCESVKLPQIPGWCFSE